MTWIDPHVTVIGAGMAGSEAAWQLAQAGLRVALVEMKPVEMSPAHQSPLFGELVCSNSLRSNDVSTPAGMLKRELRGAGSMVIAAADQHRVPAGEALAVERIGFARAITTKLALHPNIRLERRVATEWPKGKTIVATGPLTAGALGETIRRELGGDRMYFYDAIAPIVAADSIDMDLAYKASRWDKHTADDGKPAKPEDDSAAGGDVGVGDYINCPLNKEEFYGFVDAVLGGRKVTPHEFEEPRYFDSCLPIEVIAERGRDALRFGPMKPIGLDDPRTGRWPFAVLQLRPENRYLTAYNMVGFQTRLAYPEQQRIFSMVPALRNAEFVRYGSIHRNTYIDAPAKLGANFELRTRPDVHFAGLLTGVEGYIESIAMGLLVSWLIAAELTGKEIPPPPPTTMMGALYHHVTAERHGSYKYQPTNVNYGLLPPIEGEVRKDHKKVRMAKRAGWDFPRWLDEVQYQMR